MRIVLKWSLAVLLAGSSLGAAGAATLAETSSPPPPPVPGAQPQVKDDLFSGTEKFAQGASDVTEVNLDRNMLGAMNGKGKEGDAAQKMKFIVVHSYTYDKPGMYRMEDVEEYQKKLTTGSWNCFIHVRERKNGESTDICSRKDPDNNNEMVIITAEPKELTFVHLSGQMSLNQLSMMGQMGAMTAGMPGGMGASMLMNMVPPAPPTPPTPAAPVTPPASGAPRKP